MWKIDIYDMNLCVCTYIFRLILPLIDHQIRIICYMFVYTPTIFLSLVLPSRQTIEKEG